LVGPYPDFGSSEIDDARLLLATPELRGRVIRCGHLDEEVFGRALKGAGVLVFPSLTEGFGLPPFEAALDGTPAATPDHGVFREVVPESARILRGFDLSESARGVLDLLSDTKRSQRVVDDLVSAAGKRSWSTVAVEVASLIEDSLRRPRNPIRTIVAESTLISV
jgi:glycosyltransferase involved in cell wall biosynthesis